MAIIFILMVLFVCVGIRVSMESLDQATINTGALLLGVGLMLYLLWRL